MVIFNQPDRFKVIDIVTGANLIEFSTSGDEGLFLFGVDPILIRDLAEGNKIVQSLGIYDRNGQEVYDGDCLKQLGEDGYMTVVWDPVNVEFHLESSNKGVRYINAYTSKTSFSIIGNRWMPLEELERRAKEACGANKDEGGLRG